MEPLEQTYCRLARRERLVYLKLALAAVAIGAVVLVLAFVVLHRPVMIRYHLHKAREARTNTENILLTERQQQSWQGFYRFKLEQLEDMGYFEHRTFTFRHLNLTPAVARLFWDEVQRRFEDPDTVHAWLEPGGITAPDRLLVWDRPGRIARWEKLVADVDRADFAARPTGGP